MLQTLLSALVFFATVGGVNSISDPSKLPLPILWRPSGHGIAEKVMFRTLNFTIRSPCNGFRYSANQIRSNGSSKTPESISNQLIEYGRWCDTIYDRLIAQQIRKNCPTVTEIRSMTPNDTVMMKQQPDDLSKRIKRSFMAPDALISASIVSVVSSLGHYAFQLFSGQIDQARMQDIESMTFQHHQQFRLAQKTSHRIHQELFRELVSLSDKVDELSRFIDQREHVNGESYKLLVATISKMFQIESYFRDFFAGLQQGLVSSHFDHLFPNLTLCQNCPRDHWIGYGCEKLPFPDDNENLNMILNLATFDLDNRYSIVEADPFVMAYQKDRTTVCFRRYNGGRFFIYERDTECIKEMITPPVAVGRPYTVMFRYPRPKNGDCSKILNTSITSSSWTTTYCKNPNKIDPEDVVQIKSDHYYNFIYCYSTTLGIQDQRQFRCGINNIYKLDRNVSFRIDNTTISVVKLHSDKWAYIVPPSIVSDLKFSTPTTRNISGAEMKNHRYPVIKELLDQERQLKNELEASLSYSERERLMKIRWTQFLLLFLFVLIFLIIFLVAGCFLCNCCGLLSCCCRCRKQRQRVILA